MAYMNVKDWSVEQVTDWLKGIDPTIKPYVDSKSFENNGVNGHRLLNLRVDDLEHLGMEYLGHQELILEAVEHLRNFHYELDKENLQMLAMHLSCTSNSLNRELHTQPDDTKMLQTQTLSDVHTVMSMIKPLVCWLDKAPFAGDKVYNELKSSLLQMGLEMATTAHRDNFTVEPNKSIRDICDRITKLADKIIQEISDPMILQPATLDLCTIKKKEQDCGFSILPSNNGVHQITEISVSHINTKLEDGDEIVQVNYQTVVGWNPKEVMHLLEISPPEIVLTLKKRPRHTKVYGQIYMKPYRLPSRKRSAPFSRWNENLPSPRLLAIPDLPQIAVNKLTPAVLPIPETEADVSSSESDCEPPDSPLENAQRLYPLKPRSVLQRRNTITGATPMNVRSSAGLGGLEEVKHMMRSSRNAATTCSSYTLARTDRYDDEPYIRDKSASCSHGLERELRPSTVIGFGASSLRKKIVNFDDTRTIIDAAGNSDRRQLAEPGSAISATSLSSLRDESIEFIDECEDLQDRSKMTHPPADAPVNDTNIESVSDATISPPSVKAIKETINEAHKVRSLASVSIRDTVLEDIRIDNIIKKFEKPSVAPRMSKQPPPPPAKPAILPRTAKIRGKLDKSHSTPAYDLQEEPDELLLVKTEVKHDKTPEKSPELPARQPIKQETTIEKATLPNIPDKNEKLPDTRIKYELGIPLVRYPPISAEQRKTKMEVPPKPPPRTNIPEQYKKPEVPDTISAVSTANQSTIQNKTDFDMKQVNDGLVSTPLKPVATNMLETLNKANNEGETSTLPIPTRVDFDPKLASTPITKQFKDDNKFKEKEETSLKSSMSNLTTISASSSRDVFKIETHKPAKEKEHKTSPSTSLVRAICNTGKSKSKKKSSLLLKRRKVTVNDVSPGEMEGFLHQRLKSNDSNIHWEKRWFVLNQHCLYGFASKEATKAECYIVLSGFTVTEATEVKSRMNAFKVYHTGTVFYFSAESKETLNFWLETISVAIAPALDLSKSTDEIQYSETDNESETDTNTLSSTKSEKSEGIIKFNSLKKLASRKRDVSVSSSSGSTSLDRKRFFNKSSSTQKNIVPVKTAQFRSYRKISNSTTIGNFTSHIPNFAENKEEINPDSSLEATDSASVTTKSVANASIDSIPNSIQQETVSTPVKPPSRLNTRHASNPSLCNVEQLSFYGFPSHKSRNDDNMQGFLTLEELMIRESQGMVTDLPPINPNLIHPDVVYGEVPVRSRGHKTHIRTSSDCTEAKDSAKKESSCFGKRSSSIKSRNKEREQLRESREIRHANNSLPRTPVKHGEPLYMSQKQKSSSSKNLKASDSYEMIYRPQETANVHYAQNRSLYNDPHVPAQMKSMSLKSATQYTPMSLPLSRDDKKYSSHGFELHLDHPTSQKKSVFKFFQKKDKTPSKAGLNYDSNMSSYSGMWTSPDKYMSSSASADSFRSYSPALPERTMAMSHSQSQVIQDYPDHVYPPVFEAETYSLSNPQGTLFRKQAKK